MSKLSVVNLQGAAAGDLEWPDALLVKTGGDQAVHDVVVAYQAGLRAGTASTLTKGTVAGSGKKPWRQKGTGRARAGYRQSPVWRGGGVAFGPHPRDYAKRLPRKVARLAFRVALSRKILAGEGRILDALTLPEPKTKQVVGLLKALGLTRGALLVVDKLDAALVRAVRNMPKVEATTAHEVHTYQVLRFPVVVLTRAAVAVLQHRLQGEAETAA